MRYLISVNDGHSYLFVDGKDPEEAKRKGAELAYRTMGVTQGKVDAFRQDGPPLRYSLTLNVVPVKQHKQPQGSAMEDAFDMVGTKEIEIERALRAFGADQG